MTKGWDHDPPAKEKLVPFGVLMLATGVLTLLFGTAETSDFWGDCLRVWWQSVRSQCRKVRRLVIYLDNGPKNSGSRTQFLKRIIEFADWSGLEIRLVYYPPYHSKYNPIERCWGILEQHWNGTLLRDLQTLLGWARSMTWKGIHPIVYLNDKIYKKGISLTKRDMRDVEDRLERNPVLPKWDILIQPA